MQNAKPTQRLVWRVREPGNVGTARSLNVPCARAARRSIKAVRRKRRCVLCASVLYASGKRGQRVALRVKPRRVSPVARPQAAGVSARCATNAFANRAKRRVAARVYVRRKRLEEVGRQRWRWLVVRQDGNVREERAGMATPVRCFWQVYRGTGMAWRECRA